MSGMAILWETIDRLGRPVVLTDEGWAHNRSRHGDMVEYLPAIQEAVAFADEVARDATYAHRAVHYRRWSAPPWLRVIVNYRPRQPDGWAGTVITAHFIRVCPPDEVLIWPFQSRN